MIDFTEKLEAKEVVVKRNIDEVTVAGKCCCSGNQENK